jgi:tetratricopeptide (TPR) repeat protein
LKPLLRGFFCDPVKKHSQPYSTLSISKRVLQFFAAKNCALLITLFWFNGFFANPAFARYDFNANCIKAYNKIISLDFEAGRNLLTQELAINPDNKTPVLLENYIDFLILAIGEEPSDFEILKPRRHERIRVLSSGDPNSAWRRHSLAAVHLQWAFVRVRFGEYISAGLDLNRAYRLLKENRVEHPEFVPDLLLSGVMNALIGSIPENYQWAARLAGMQGTIETARKNLYEMIEIAENNPEWSHLLAEAFFYLSFIEMNLQGDKNLVHELLQRMQNIAKLKNGPLLCYIKANLSIRTGNNDQAIKILENCLIADGSYPFYYLDFLLGTALLNRIGQQAASHFLRFVNQYKGSNYIKSAYQRLAWLALLDGDQNAYRFYITQVLQHGQTFVDEDKQAQTEALSGKLPNTQLLKARLLFDGGYYQQAIRILDGGLNSGACKRDTVEFIYRKARIFHESGKLSEAKDFYGKTIEAGSGLPYFFAGNSALQLGLMYENEDDLTGALSYYNLCLNMKFTEYRSSIHQKARAGLRRVSAQE